MGVSVNDSNAKIVVISMLEKVSGIDNRDKNTTYGVRTFSQVRRASCKDIR